MVLAKNSDSRCLRRYRICFVIGFIILTFQLYLAIRFFSLGIEPLPNTDQWNPLKTINEDSENSVNSARRLKDGLVMDDEDNVENQLKPKNLIRSNHKLNQTRLRLEELDFVPACEIITKEAISAIHRAKTQRCKQEIANITCLIAKNLLYPKLLPNFCPSNGFVKGKSLGCFKDNKTYRLLSGYYGNNKKNNSPEFCMNLCLQSGFPYAGVQYS